jgi:hypothetical protein
MKIIVQSFMFLVLLLCGISCSKRNVEVAQYDGGVVMRNELSQIISGMSVRELDNLQNKDDYYKFVRKIALEQIILKEVEKSGLLNEPEIQEKLSSIRRNTAFEILHARNVIDKIKVVEGDYAEYSTVYDLYHIVCRTDTLKNEKIEQSKKLLKRLSTEIKSLSDFKEAAKKYSEDTTSYEGGHLGKIRFGIMDSAIDDALKKMQPGKVSDIVETYAGLHLLWVDSTEKADMEELFRDRRLYDAIYAQKQEDLENVWYTKLLEEKDLQIIEDNIGSSNEDSEVVIYQGRKITMAQIKQMIDDLRKNGFPTPTKSELKMKVKDMAAKLVLEVKMESPELLESNEFKAAAKSACDYYLMNEYIDRNKVLEPVTDVQIQEFYDKNQTTLFTFKDENGKTFVQPLAEVKKFIEQKVQDRNIQTARYQLYQNLIKQYNLQISDDALLLLMKERGLKA